MHYSGAEDTSVPYAGGERPEGRNIRSESGTLSDPPVVNSQHSKGNCVGGGAGGGDGGNIGNIDCGGGRRGDSGSSRRRRGGPGVGCGRGGGPGARRGGGLGRRGGGGCGCHAGDSSCGGGGAERNPAIDIRWLPRKIVTTCNIDSHIER
ncbi:hypothetical protein FHG87_013886 [Trinorchestia longiramus]|nr:hypothetical protein FHG87_013886 [Trinorchestia longiramus]